MPLHVFVKRFVRHSCFVRFLTMVPSCRGRRTDWEDVRSAWSRSSVLRSCITPVPGRHSWSFPAMARLTLLGLCQASGYLIPIEGFTIDSHQQVEHGGSNGRVYAIRPHLGPSSVRGRIKTGPLVAHLAGSAHTIPAMGNRCLIGGLRAVEQIPGPLCGP